MGCEIDPESEHGSAEFISRVVGANRDRLTLGNSRSFHDHDIRWSTSFPSRRAQVFPLTTFKEESEYQ